MKNSYEILYDSKTRIKFKRGVICKISIKKKKICLQFCFIWVLRDVSIYSKNLPGGACPWTLLDRGGLGRKIKLDRPNSVPLVNCQRGWGASELMGNPSLYIFNTFVTLYT